MPFLVGFLLVVAVAVYRVFSGMAGADGESAWVVNFAPVAALALCGGAFFPRRLAFALPLGALFLSDLALNLFVYNVGALFPAQLVIYPALALVVAIGILLSPHSGNLAALLGGALGGAILFYAITNTASWLANPAYARTVGGWLQALTVGMPGFPPTWVFFRNSVLSDLLFTAVFFGCMMLARHPATRRAKAQPAIATAAAH